MSNPFAKTTNAINNLQSDLRVGGVPASNEYLCNITAAYLLPNAWNPKDTDMHIEAELPSGYRHKMSFKVLANGTPMTKDKNGKEVMLWTAERAARLVSAATDGATLEDIFDSLEDKVIKLYDFEQKKDVQTTVKMFMDLVGKPVILGLQRKISNKVTKEGDDWVDLPEKKESLELGIAASASTRLTHAETIAKVDSDAAAEMNTWTKRNAGRDWDAYKKVGAASGMPAGVQAAVATSTPVSFD